MRTALVLASLTLLLACRTEPVPEETPELSTEPRLPVAETWSPPSDWATMSPLAFEKLVLDELPADTITPIREASHAELREALDRQDQSSVRAAVILGRSLHQDSGRILFNRLRKRILGPERNSDSADVVAAAALARFPKPGRYSRILRLAEGPNPHPDLDVRVECACTALYSGEDLVIPFLLQILRIGTWAGLEDELDFEASATTAWARTRAAEALSWRAGVPVSFHPDGSIASREHAVRELERILGPMVERARAAAAAEEG